MRSNNWTRKPCDHTLGEYSPSAKAFQTMGGQDEFFHEVAKFMLEVAFVTPRFYGMPRMRAKTLSGGCCQPNCCGNSCLGYNKKGK